MLYQKMLLYKNKLQKQIQQLQQKLSHLPDGHLICVTNGKYIKNIHMHNGIRTHIPKKNSDFLKKLAMKKYLSSHLEDLLKEQEALDAFLAHYKGYISQTEQLMKKASYQKIISSSFTPLSTELAQWAAEPYDRNSLHPEHLRHSCPSGHIVRSKSEVLICQALFKAQIPFRYECALNLGDVKIYPDFTIRHPETGKTFYWEHFGLMDSPTYSQNAFQKLHLYSSHGYIPTINLITTYETKENPLSIEKIDNLIQEYFM